MKKITTLVLFAFLFYPSVSRADNGEEERTGWFRTFTGNVAKTWTNPQKLDIHIPVNIWHNRLTYDCVDRYNEMPWGLGAGASRLDDKRNYHGLYFMAFKDSNSYVQTIFGYAYQKNWYWGKSDDWFAGVGFTTSLTQRYEYNYIPVPLPLPIAGFGYKNFAVQAAYVPGGKNDGNVLFTWLRASF
jgi:palmitoyl transferase